MSERPWSWVSNAQFRLWPWLQTAWWLPLGCWVLVVILDVVLGWAPNYFLLGVVDEPAHFLTSLIDVLAIAAVLTALGRRPPSAAWAVGALLAGNLIDADHIPQVLGYQGLTEGTPRPYTHSLTTVAVLLALAALPTVRRTTGRRTIGWVPTQGLDRNPHDQLRLPEQPRLPDQPRAASRSRVPGSSRVGGQRWSEVTAGLAVGVAGHLFRDAGTAPVALFWPFSYRSVDFPEPAYTVVLLLLALIPPAGFALALLRPERATGKQDDDR